MYSLDDYDYELPEALIAQKPLRVRDQSRLLVLERSSQRLSHHGFKALIDFLDPGDVLVINDTQVIPARLMGRKQSGGLVEVLLLDYVDGLRSRGRFISRCLVKASKSPKIGTEIDFGHDVKAVVRDHGRNGFFRLDFRFSGEFDDRLNELGQIPLPPYIRRHPGSKGVDDRHAYQTVYAAEKGAVAAPTAGLHFTQSFMSAIANKGIKIVRITLHVGHGTFLPVRVSDIRSHNMHAEQYAISEKAAEVIRAAQEKSGRVVAVGTTCVRTLEYAAGHNGHIQSGTGSCDLFIYPGYRFRVVDALVTNFHLPRSTLLMLVSAFAGREAILNAYREAIEKRYRFYSYGDAMLIL
jgi:S-adenosylmethionine:tRNA ribosyltransferase-isomerase